MAKLLVKHGIAVDSPLGGTTDVDFYFYAPRDAYTGIETYTGVSAPNNENSFENCPACSVEELLMSGVAVRKILRVQKAGRTYRYKIIVANNKADTFNTEIKDKTYKGGTVEKVMNPLDAVFY